MTVEIEIKEIIVEPQSAEIVVQPITNEMVVSPSVTLSNTAIWGQIPGDINNQLDLLELTNSKENLSNKTPNLLDPTDDKYPTSLAVSSALALISQALGEINNILSNTPQYSDLATVASSGDYSDLENTPSIPNYLADLLDDSSNRRVSDAEKNTWNAKQDSLTLKTVNGVPIVGTGDLHTHIYHIATVNTAIYNVGANEELILVNNTDCSIFLPDATTNSGRYLIFKILVFAGGDSPVLRPVTGQTIEGALTYSLSGINNYLTIISDGANWKIVGKYSDAAIAGSIAANQIAYGSGINAISGSGNLTYSNNTFSIKASASQSTNIFEVSHLNNTKYVQITSTGQLIGHSLFNQISFATNANGGSGIGNFSDNAVAIWANSSVACLIGYGGGYDGIKFPSYAMIGWTGNPFTPSISLDTNISRYAAGILKVGDGVGGFGTVFARAFQPNSLSDSDALNNSIYYSSTQSKLVYKDNSGTVNTLY